MDMDYLAREDAPLDEDTWKTLDEAVTATVRNVLTGRRVIPMAGPVGPGVQVAKIDHLGKEEQFEDWYVRTNNRALAEVPQLYSDFWLYWRDIEAARQCGGTLDLTAALMAAQKLARHEDEMIFYGIPDMGIEGLFTAKGAGNRPRGDWTTGETAFSDVAQGMTDLEEKGFPGPYALIVSPDVYLQLQRIQPGTGVLEIDRIGAMLGKRPLKSTALKPNSAVLLASTTYCVDLLIGQDIRVAYLEAVDLNHHFRILETALLRIKCPEAIVVLAGK